MTTPSTTDIGGALCRQILDDNADLPLLADIWRQGHYVTPTCGDGWYVQLIPTLDDVCVSGTAAPDRFLGPGLVGDTVVVAYPSGMRSTADEILSEDYRRKVLDAIGAKLAEVRAVQAAAEAVMGA